MTTTATRTPLSVFWDRHAFSVGDTDFPWADVAMAAMARGHWAAFERRLAEGLACAARAAAEDAPAPDGAIDEAAEAFRYERDLISGDEMNAWLECVGLSSADWMAYLGRDVLRRIHVAELDDVLDRFPPSPRALLAAAVAEGLCSGLFDEFRESFSGRVAVVFQADPSDVEISGPASEFETSAGRLLRQHSHWLSIRPEAETRSRLCGLLRLEASFDRAEEGIAASRDLADLVAANRMEWVCVELDTMTFADEHSAREAVLCVREDGLSLHDVAGLSRRSVARTLTFLEDTAPAHREWLLSAEPGHVLGPLRSGGGFDVIAVIRRTVPTLDDERIAARARRALVDGAVRQAARDHVRRRTKC